MACWYRVKDIVCFKIMMETWEPSVKTLGHKRHCVSNGGHRTPSFASLQERGNDNIFNFLEWELNLESVAFTVARLCPRILYVLKF